MCFILLFSCFIISKLLTKHVLLSKRLLLHSSSFTDIDPEKGSDAVMESQKIIKKDEDEL